MEKRREDRRKDPQKILDRIQAEERRSDSGKLKIYLGAAPGVGKTQTMLEDALAQHKQGLDVVIGVIETHGRIEIESLSKNFEVIPQQIMDYRGIKLSEFDLNVALQRKPSLILMDEMAHTNAPGLRHEKRWQDIQELLDRGIDVYTTLNVQHVESLNDNIAQIIHAPIKETVPDLMLELADAIELVDLEPDDLLKRLEEGKVYFPKEVAQAKEHFFRKGNLIALRELALRVTAEHVNTEVLLYRQGEGIRDIWSTKENILVCVGAGMGSLKLIRMARQLAYRFQSEWTAVYVDSAKHYISDKQRNEAVKNLRFAEQMGAQTHIINGFDVVTEILNFAREHNITLIMMRKHIYPRWKDWFRKRLVDEMIRYSDEINLYVISERGEEISFRSNGLSDWKYYGSAFLMVVFVMGIGFVANTFVTLTVNGVLVVSILGIISVALLIGRLLLIIKRQARTTRLTGHQAVTIHDLNRQLATMRGVEKILKVGVRYIADIFESEALVLMPKNKVLVVRAKSGEVQSLGDKEHSIAQWVYDLGKIAGLGTNTLPSSDALYVPLLASGGTLGVLRVRPLKAKLRLFTPEQIELLEACANQLALIVEVDSIQEQAKKLELESEIDHIRNALLQYISQDLKIPLATVISFANTLKEQAGQLKPSQIEKLGHNIYTESQELTRLINNLFQINYLEKGELKLQKSPYSLRNIIDKAVETFGKKLDDTPVIINVPDNIPDIQMDSLMMAEAFINLVDNAIKFSPPKTTIHIDAVLEKNYVVVSVRDHGLGIILEETEKVFEKFYRGRMLTTERGLGLGLSICRKIIEAHGGRIWSERHEGEGAWLKFTLPL